MWTGINYYYYNDIETQTRIELGAVVEGSLPSHNKSSSSDAWRVEYSQISELLLAGPTLGVQDCGCDDEGDPTNYQDPGQGKPDLKEKCWCFILEISRRLPWPGTWPPYLSGSPKRALPCNASYLQDFGNRNELPQSKSKVNYCLWCRV